MTLKGKARRDYMREYMRRKRAGAVKPAVKPVRPAPSDNIGREAEPQITPDMLSKTAQEKLEIAKRMMERKLKAEHAARMHGIDEEVRQRVLVETKEYLAMVKEREEQADKTISLYQEFTNNRKPLFTADQFNLLRKCLHQSGIAASPRDFDAAFNLIQTKKFQLTGKKA